MAESVAIGIGGLLFLKAMQVSFQIWRGSSGLCQGDDEHQADGWRRGRTGAILGETGAESSIRGIEEGELLEGGDGGRVGDVFDGEAGAEEEVEDGGGGGDGGGEFGRGS
jgi:hypothetical protein